MSYSRKETTHHILNGCKVSLNQQRYTWRHDNILRYICENVGSEKYQLNADIDGYSLPGGGTNSPDLCVTPERPDIVIHDRLTNELCIFELTVPLETNILNAHTRKAEKYSHFIQDITSANVKVIPFEIGSRGYISPDNKTSLKLLFKYCSKETTYRMFMKNISAISSYSSYYICIYTKKIPQMGPPPTTNRQSVPSPLLMWSWPWPCPWPSTTHRYWKSTPANQTKVLFCVLWSSKWSPYICIIWTL